MNEHRYLQLLQQILVEGEDKLDRTGVGTKSLFGTTLRFDLSEGKIPLLTTKKVFWKGVVEELLFFVAGKTQSKELEDKGVKIWTGNTSREFLNKRGLHSHAEGEMGPMYGYNWRSFNAPFIRHLDKSLQDADPRKDTSRRISEMGIDQLQNVFDSLKNDPDSRRHLVIATDPTAANRRVLDECHYAFQFYVSNGDELSCMWQQRSVDSFLGLPFNIASYGLLTHLMANALGYKAKSLIFNGGDTHIYNNHVEQVKEQITRSPFAFPTLTIAKELNSLQDIEQLQFGDLVLNNYQSHPAIKAPMAI